MFKKILKNIFWDVYGRTIYNPPIPSHIKSILFICRGNICRSPFAEHFAKHFFNFSNEYNILSAGINVKDSVQPPSQAIITGKKFGVNLADHRSRPINYDLIEAYDLIIAMETWQYNFLRKIFLEFREKILLLPLLEKNYIEWNDKYFIYNIKDPYGRDDSEFEICFKRIDSCLNKLFNLINSK